MMKSKKIWIIPIMFILWIGSFLCYGKYIEIKYTNHQYALVGRVNEEYPDITYQLFLEDTNEEVEKGKEIIQKKDYSLLAKQMLHDRYASLFIWILSTALLIILFYIIGIKYYKEKKEEDFIYDLDRLIDRTYQSKNDNHLISIKLNQLNQNMMIQDQDYLLVKEQMKQFIEDVAHQIKTPLTALKMNVELEENLKNQLYVERIETIVTELIRLSKLEAHQLQFNFEYNSLEECIDTVLDDLKIYQIDKELKVEIEDINFYFDDLWLGEALLNIMKNACEYANYSILLQTQIIDQKVIIKIMDDGKEINEEESKHIFDRFYTTKDSRKSNGMGIGLNIAYEVVKAHMGNIYAFTNHGFTTFLIELPLIEGKEKI